MIKINGISPAFQSVAYAAASNGIEVLNRPKFTSMIAKTVVSQTAGGIKKAIYLDSKGRALTNTEYQMPGTELPMIGEIIYDSFTE